MKIVAFLQNQWFRDPESIKRMFAENPDRRERYISAFLFMGCLTGKRLQSVFGQELCDAIIWEETSCQVGGHSASKFPPDAQHMAQVIVKHRPEVVLLFGAMAREGMKAIERDVLIDCELLRLPLRERYYNGFQMIHGPHPAARNSAIEGLRKMRQELSLARARLEAA